jgi:hypothetical protein
LENHDIQIPGRMEWGGVSYSSHGGKIVDSQEIRNNEENANNCKVLSERKIGTDGDSVSLLAKGKKQMGDTGFEPATG